MQGLHRQANTQIAAVALKHTNIATDHVVQHLVAAAVARVIDGAGVVLQVDPVRHHHRCGHDQFEHAKAGVALPLVVVQETTARQVEMAATAAWRNNESGAVGQAPFGPHLRPVGGPGLDGIAQLIRLGSQCGQAKRGGTLGTCALPGVFQPARERGQVLRMALGQQIGVKQLHLVGSGVVQTREKVGRVRHQQAVLVQSCTHGGLVEQLGQHARVDLSGLATTSTAVQARSVRVVGAGAAVACYHNEPRVACGQPHRAECGGCQVDTRCQVRAAAGGQARAKLLQRLLRQASLLDSGG